MSLGFFWENKTRKDVIVELFGTVVVYIIMACAVTGAIASAIKPESELGQQFVAGVDSRSNFPACGRYYGVGAVFDGVC